MKPLETVITWRLGSRVVLWLLVVTAFSAMANAQAITLGEAVDNTSLTWTTGGEANWFGQTSVYFYGGDAAQSGNVASGQSSWIQTTVIGPGVLSFYWKDSSVFGDLTFSIDGVQKSSYWYFHGWELQIFPIPSGSHTLRWVYKAYGSGEAGFLDKVVFTEGPWPTIGEAVDNTSLVWTTGGTEGWFGQTEVYYYDGDAARSGNMPEGSSRSSWIQTTVTGPGILSFYWKVSSFYEMQDLTFYIDGVKKSSCWAYEWWEPQVYPIPSGSHTLRWVYEPVYHDSTGSVGYLDKVVFTEGPWPTIGEAVDNPSLVWTTGGTEGWFGQTEVYYYDGDAARSGNVTEGQSSWIETTVTGPGILSFYWKGINPFMIPDFMFYIDGVQKSRYQYGRDGPWIPQVYPIPSGIHALRWVLTPGSGAPGSAFLDKVVLIQGPALMVQAPNGGETLYRRDFYAIRWMSTEGVGPHVKLELYRGERLHYTISASTDNDGYYQWFVPIQMEAGTDYRIMVTSTSNLSIYDHSDSYFTIAEEPLASLRGLLVLDGTDDYAAATDHAELDVGDEEGESLTVETWVNFQTFGDAEIVTKSAYRLYTKAKFQYPYSYKCLAGEVRLQGGVTPFMEVCHTQYSGKGFWVPGWHHVALVFDRTSAQLSLYVDGEKSTSSVSGLVMDSGDPLKVGMTLPGVVDEVRISDIARYTGTFTPPTSPFTCDAHTRALWHLDEYDGATRFHDACGVDNLLVGYYGAHSAGGPGCDLADVNTDSAVTIDDIQLVVGRWRARRDDANYVPAYDLNYDGIINIVDTQLGASRWNPTCSKGINGLVTFNGTPAAGLNLDLGFWDGITWSTRATTTTGPDGRYNFTAVPSLGANQVYYVRYVNTPTNPNPSPGYLWSWLANMITAYGAGTALSGGDFDVADIPLVSPSNGASVTLPFKFCWTLRGVLSDNYRLMFYYPDANQWAFTDYLGRASCLTISGLPTGWPSGATYWWWVRAYQGTAPDSTPYNFGDSYYSRQVIINYSTPASQSEPGTLLRLAPEGKDADLELPVRTDLSGQPNSR